MTLSWRHTVLCDVNDVHKRSLHDFCGFVRDEWKRTCTSARNWSYAFISSFGFQKLCSLSVSTHLWKQADYEYLCLCSIRRTFFKTLKEQIQEVEVEHVSRTVCSKPFTCIARGTTREHHAWCLWTVVFFPGRPQSSDQIWARSAHVSNRLSARCSRNQ